MFNSMLSMLAAIMPIHGDASVVALGTILGMCIPVVGVLTTTVTRQKSLSLYRALVTVAWDASYLTGGEVLDVSSVFPNRCFGAIRIAASLNDAVAMTMYVQAASQAPATGVLQAYNSTTGAPSNFVQAASMTDLSAMDTEVYEIIGD